MRFKACLFDWDDTLVSTWSLILEAHNHVRKLMNLTLWGHHDLYGGVSRSARELYPEIYGDKAEWAQDRLYEYIHEHHLDHLSVKEGAEDLLISLKKKGIFLGVVSNKRHDVLLKEIQHLGWHDLFGVAAIGAGKAPKDKPAVDPLMLALEEIQIIPSKENVLYVGDTETDLKCGRSAKVSICLVTNNQDHSSLIRTYGPDLVVNEIRELKSLLDVER